MVVRWGWLLAGVLAMTVFVVLRRRRTADRVLWDSHAHEEAQFSGFASWRDCTGRAPSGTELKRAYRQLARQAHPDKDGSNERFQALDDAQRQLQDPVQYNLRAAFVPGGNTQHGHGVHDARLALQKSDGGTRIRLEVDFTSLAPRGLWRFGLLARDVSSIEYSGSNGGYDMCCQFLKDSRCTFKPYSELVAQHEAHTDTAWDSAYTTHDCPLEPGSVYTGVVDKPLHVSADGLWAAVLEIVDPDGQELACAAVTFRTEGDELVRIDQA